MVDAADRRAFATLVSAACVDGDLSPPEREVLHRKATEYDIPTGLMRELIDQGVQGRLAVAVPPGQAEREALFDDLIDVACADGRIEASEHHLLAKFASHLGLQLPDLRARVRKRLQEKPAAPAPKRGPEPEPPRERPKAPELPKTVAPPTPPVVEPAALPPGPVTLRPPSLIERGVSDIPPIALQLIKQSILFDTGSEMLRYVERTLNLTKPEAEEVLKRILEAFPDLKPGSQQLRGGPPKKK